MVSHSTPIFSSTLIRLSEFLARDGEKHRQMCYDYASLPTEAAKAAFFLKYGVRWTEFARLKYFDLVKWTVIDPMHNLLLGRLSLKPYQIPPQYKKPQGVAKTQWYTQWIKQGTLRPDTAKFTRELTFIHDFMKTVRIV
jgi:hypothetical protein